MDAVFSHSHYCHCKSCCLQRNNWAIGYGCCFLSFSLLSLQVLLSAEEQLGNRLWMLFSIIKLFPCILGNHLIFMFVIINIFPNSAGESDGFDILKT